MNFKKEIPKEGQESVWDYPRPPKLDPTNKQIRVIFEQITIVDSTKSIRCLETSHPPAYYVPFSDVKFEYLTDNKKRTYCEFKG
mmetsp:Transcript_35416/g.31894  ORF Transcript_35416/g.31894 Transcript_35416/m.31894 type:complete len:84 (-) Transcript_35416:318-569(-)